MDNPPGATIVHPTGQGKSLNAGTQPFPPTIIAYLLKAPARSCPVRLAPPARLALRSIAGRLGRRSGLAVAGGLEAEVNPAPWRDLPAELLPVAQRRKKHIQSRILITMYEPLSVP